MKSDEYIPPVRLPDAVLGPITKNSQIGFRRLAAKFEDECQRERTHPCVHFSMFDPLRDAGYRGHCTSAERVRECRARQRDAGRKLVRIYLAGDIAARLAQLAEAAGSGNYAAALLDAAV